MTRLDEFMKAHNDMTPSAFARRAGISRQQLLRLRYGRAEPTRPVMIALAEAASAMRLRPVFVVELFELAQADEVMRQLLAISAARP